MRILHITAPAPVGGLERVVLGLTTGLKVAGHEPRVAAILDPGVDNHPLVRALETAGVPVHPIHVAGRQYGMERARIEEIGRMHGVDVVHTHGYHPDVIDGPVARRLQVPVASTVHGFTGGGLRNRLYEWLQIRAYRRFDAVIAVSTPIVDRLTKGGVPVSRVHHLPNAWVEMPGVPPLDRAAAREALGVPRGGVRLGWVGRMSPEKGPDVVIDALARLKRPHVHLSMIGDGPALKQVQAQAKTLGVDSQVTWHGLVADAGRLLAACDAVVLSSRTEGTPIILFEAIAARVPVVTTAVGGIPAVVSEREAVLVPAEDPSALAHGIARALDDRAGALARSTAASERVAFKFAARPWVERHVALYQSLRPTK
ncbi:MAG TPA: glycosyltransferase family 4 protein [Gemmatimonadales bacterium]|nr:glycosyltransferase family 4 protein [Gemmatimonadales bacterium]